jgi:ketosteroid isomerase-like protein
MKMPRVRPWLVAAMVLGVSSPAVVRAQAAGRDVTNSAERATEDSLLMQQERGSWEALKARDTTAFAHLMGGGVVDVDVSGAKRTSPASTARYVQGCETTSYGLTDVRVAHTGAAAIVTYTATVVATCWGQKAPSPLYVMTVYAQRGASWLPIAHSETPAARR